MTDSSRSVNRATAQVALRRPRPLSSLREHLRDTFWFAPTVGLVGAAVLAGVCGVVDDAVLARLREQRDLTAIRSLIGWTANAEAVVGTIGAGMLSLVGVVFSISLVAVQIVSAQWSQRVVRLYVRDRTAKATFSAFLATFVFALWAQFLGGGGSRDPATAREVPFVTSAVAVALVLVSLVLFVAYVSTTVSLLRVSRVIEKISRDAAKILALRSEPAVFDRTAPVSGTLAYRGRAGVLRDVHVARLCRLAQRQQVVVHLLPRIGDYLVPGAPVFAVHGKPRSALDERAVLRTLNTGAERTFHQDIGFGLRQLVDIALKALSPAVNDPTTAVQAIDRIQEFLTAAVDHPLGVMLHRDRAGAVRLAQDLPGWRGLVQLAFSEIRPAGAGRSQVTRRLRAALEDLLRLAAHDRQEVLRRELELLEQAVARTVADEGERDFALTADRQGIG